MHRPIVALPVLWLAFACTGSSAIDEPEVPIKPTERDGGVTTTRDAGIASDAGFVDAGFTDAGDVPSDAGRPFTGCAGRGAAFDTFNAFWMAFDEQYALFDIRLPNGDWDEIGRTSCTQVFAGMPEPKLFAVLVSMAERFDDGHVQIESPGGLMGDGWVNEFPYYEAVASLEGNIENNYIDETAFTWAAEDWFAWGTVGDVGYVSITSMDGLSQSKDEDDDRAAANAAMQQVMNDIGGSAAMIVDVRANEGGWDTVALDVATWFAGARTIAWSERVRTGAAHDDFGPWVDQYVEAARPQAFAGPVILLTGLLQIGRMEPEPVGTRGRCRSPLLRA